MRIKLRGKSFRMTRSKLEKGVYGECVIPLRRGKQRRIRIKRGIRGKFELDVLIHEMLHGCVWDLSEKAVDESAHDIAKVLWKLGYRKTR